jgi:hypothetical protein
MNCPDYHDQLHQHLDGQAPVGRAALDQHLAACAACREYHAAAQRLTEGMRLMGRPVPPADLAGRVVARVLAERRAAVRFRRRLWTAAAVAAGLLLMALAGYQVYRAGLLDNGTGDTPRVARDNAPAKDKTAIADNKGRTDPADPASLGEALEEARTAALLLTRRTAGETVNQARRLLPPANPLAVPLPSLTTPDPLGPVLDPPAESLRQAGQTVSAGLQPVTSSARRALDLFFQQVPPVNAEGKTGL